MPRMNGTLKLSEELELWGGFWKNRKLEYPTLGLAYMVGGFTSDLADKDVVVPFDTLWLT